MSGSSKYISCWQSKLDVPERPIIGLLEGDGSHSGLLTEVTEMTSEAVNRAYKGKRRIAWNVVPLRIEKDANNHDTARISQTTLEELRRYLVCLAAPTKRPCIHYKALFTALIPSSESMRVCRTKQRGVDFSVYSPSSYRYCSDVEFLPQTEDLKGFLSMCKGNFPKRFRMLPQGDKQIASVSTLSIEEVGACCSHLQHRSGFDSAPNSKKHYAIVLGDTDLASEQVFAEWITKALQKQSKLVSIVVMSVGEFVDQVFVGTKGISIAFTSQLGRRSLLAALAAMVRQNHFASRCYFSDQSLRATFQPFPSELPDQAVNALKCKRSILLAACDMLEYIGWQEAADELWDIL